MIEEKYRHKLPAFESGRGAADVESDTSLFLGLGTQSMAGRMAVCVMPELSEHIGTELSKEAAISKGRVKAHELRAQLKKLQKGGGKGNKDDE